MGSEKVQGRDDPPVAAVNAVDLLAGEYKVTADGGVSVSADGKAYFAKKGETIDLNGDAARALMNEGSIKRA